MSTKYGYVRVSTADQNEARQIDAMNEIGIPPNHIYIDKQSGKDFNRKAYKRLLRKVKENDVIYIKSIDRLGRNYEEIQEQWNELKKRNISIVVLDMPLLDTRERIDGITGQFIADMVLQVLSYVAHIERDNIKQRQAEGIKAAHERGVQFGRPVKDTPEEFDELCILVKEKKLSGRQAAKMLGIPKTTFYRKLQQRSSSEIKENNLEVAEGVRADDSFPIVDNLKRLYAKSYYHRNTQYSIYQGQFS